MDSIEQRLQEVLQQIRDTEQAAQRQPASVALLAVSKTWPIESILAAAACGQRLFGENYVQEAIGKFDFVRQHHPELNLEWHFIGHLQSNKSRDIATRFDWVHSIDRLKLAKRLNDQRPSEMPPLNVCLQVNISNEASKSGFRTAEVTAAAHAIKQLPQLRLRGLMAIPAASDDPDRQRAAFAQMHQLQRTLTTEGLELDTLSMGMSGDMAVAIAEGSTMVRIGTALFGQRNYAQ